MNARNLMHQRLLRLGSAPQESSTGASRPQIDSQLTALLLAPLLPGETFACGFDRKEREIGEVFAHSTRCKRGRCIAV